MIFRKTIFWLHLAAGLIAGMAIGIMCFTGATLAFEKQLVAFAERDVRTIVPPVDATERRSIDELLRGLRTAFPDARLTAITLSTEPTAAVAFTIGRDRTLYADPYTGLVREPASSKMRGFMRTMETWHRWLAVPGDARPIGKAINGAANVAFFVLALTGLYLWLPRSWSWRSVRAVAFFNARLSGKARDFNWHNSLGLWCAPVLIVLTLTAMPISYRWANLLVYRIVGDQPPVPAGPGAGATGISVQLPATASDARPLPRDAQFAAVRTAFPNWEQITLRLANPAPNRSPSQAQATVSATAGNDKSPPSFTAMPLTFTVKRPSTWPRTATTTVVLDPVTGKVLRQETFADQTAGRRLRGWTRFLHTGEALGWMGQLVAGTASLAGCVLVYTGVALAWGRFFGRRAVVTATATD